MRYLLPLPLTILLVLASCSSDKDRIAEIVEEWQGREIVFPEVMTDFLTEDTIDLRDADFTILTFVDSTGCTDCKMKLPVWNILVDSVYTKVAYNVKFCMIIEAMNSQKLMKTLKNNKVNLSIFVDLHNKMFSKYKIPKETALQTFLLDHNFKVLAVGNPIYASGIDSLYRAVLTGKTTISHKQYNLVTVEDDNIDLGFLQKNEPSKQLISFTNYGNDSIIITNVVPSCNCTELIIPQKIIPPHSTLNAEVIFKGDTIIGNFDRSIQIFYKDFDYPSVISINGHIK